MKILIAGAGLLLVAMGSPAVANGGGGGQNHNTPGSASKGFGHFSGLITGLRLHQAIYGGSPGFFSHGNHYGWSRGHHWGWYKPHNPHWPHDHPASP